MRLLDFLFIIVYIFDLLGLDRHGHYTTNRFQSLEAKDRKVVLSYIVFRIDVSKPALKQ